MNSSRQTIRHLLVVTLLGSPLITPLLQWTAATCTHDGHLHYHRVAAMRHAWQNGLVFSRWLPDVAFGYGYPFFIYREPLPLYLVGFFHWLGLPLSAASNLLYVLSILAAGWFMYLWVNDIFGGRSAIVAAVAYMAAPYILVDALIRGNLMESMGLALLPLLCWSGRRFLLDGRAAPFLTAVLALAALSLSHNISLLLFTPLLGLYLLILGLLHRLDRRPLLARLLLLFGLGLGLTLFHTGTALLELDAITISQSTNTRGNNFRFNFASLDEILAPVTAEDPSLINPPLPFRLGWAPLFLALLGLVTAARQRQRQQRWHIALMALAAAGLLFMALPASLPIWENLPLIEFVQFPWRFIGRAALPLALLAGAPFALLPTPTRTNISGSQPQPARVSRSQPQVAHGSRFAPLLALTLLLLEAIPMLYPNICSELPYPTIQTVLDYERETGMVGVDPTGSYFPKTVQQRPQGSPLESDYTDGRAPQRFDTSALPEGAIVRALRYKPTGVDLRLDSPAPFTARYLSFDFPGWIATVDGRPVPITPSEPEGLITFPVPAGQHTITVRWQMTPGRTVLAAISLICLVAVAAVTVQLRRREQSDDSAGLAHRPLHHSEFISLALLAGAFLLLKVAVFDGLETPLRRAAAPPVAQTVSLTAAELQLEGYNLSREQVAAGNSFDIDLAWRAVTPPAADYQSNVWLVGPDGAVWSDKETHRPRVYEPPAPTRFWQPGQWGWDSREVTVLPGTPPGQYDIVLTLFPLSSLQPVTLQGTDGVAVGPTAVIGRILVTRPAVPPTVQAQFPSRETVNGLNLLGYNQDRDEAAPGDPLLLTLFWEKRETALGETLILQLRDAGERIVQSWTIPPVRSDYPPRDWRVGERLRGQHGLRLAAALESGDYRFYLESIPLGELTIQAPPRMFEPPAFETAVDADFAGQVTLVGYSPAIRERELTVSLVWRGESEMTASYQVFVHLVDAAGNLIAQSDAEPAAWSRPTSGWAPGEYILDNHMLSLPEAVLPGNLQLRVGLYDPATGARLPSGTADFATLMIES